MILLIFNVFIKLRRERNYYYNKIIFLLNLKLLFPSAVSETVQSPVVLEFAFIFQTSAFIYLKCRILNNSGFDFI